MVTRIARFSRNVTLVAALVMVAACSGGGSRSYPIPDASTLPGNNGAGGLTPQSVTLHMIFGGENGQTSSAAQVSRQGTRHRSPLFVSPSTEGVLAQVFPHGNSTVVGSSATDVSPGSSACGGSSSPTRTCTVAVPAPVGADDFTFTTYDAKPTVPGVGGSIPASAHVLGTGAVANQSILANQNNALTIYISGVIANIGNSATYASLPANGSAQNFAFVIDPQDFDNNPITAGINDPFANPITVTLTETGGSGNASLILNGTNVGASAVMKESSDTLQLAYSGGGVPGYGATVAFNAAAAPTQSVAVSPLYVTSLSSYFSNRALAFTQSAQSASLDITELNAPSSITYTATPSSGCTNVANAGAFIGTGAAASVPVTAGSSAGTGCTIAITDSLGTTLSLAAALTTSGDSINVPGSVTEYSIPTAGSRPYRITVGPDGALWFTENFGDNIGRITTAGAFTEFPIGSLGNAARGIATGSDGALWFTEAGSNNIGRMTTAGVVTQYAIPTLSDFPYDITAGPDGALWFAETGQHKIGRITTGGGFTEYPIPTVNGAPYGITAGPNGNLWFTESAGNKVGEITTAGVFTEFPIPTANSFATSIVTGSDGNLWFVEGIGNNVGRITTAGVITEFPVPGGGPSGIAAGPDGALWFTEVGTNQIGRITTAGVITQYTIPTTSSGPYGIVAGPDGAMWFTETNGNKIGRIIP